MGATVSEAVVFIQLQNNLPECFWDTLRKTREMYKGDIYLIAPEREFAYIILKELDIKTISKDKMCSSFINEYEQKTFLKYDNWDGFWDNTCKRFIYLYLFMERYKIDEVLHVETDCVCYMDIEEMLKSFKRVYDQKIVFIPHAPEQLNAGIVYCNSLDVCRVFCDSILEYFGRGKQYFLDTYKTQKIITETVFTYAFYKEHPELVDLFPAMPGDLHHEELGFFVDPDGWGRWVDGLRYSPGISHAIANYHIGAALLKGIYDIHFAYENAKIKMPYVHDNFTRLSYPLATLHFNSKRVNKWL